MATERLGYLPALDGLRAVAVTLVVAYHLDFGWARGGFLGVDLFFVISGFLITTLLIREHDSAGRIALGSFWTRRFRRLVPPLVIMTAATVAATRLYGLPEQWSSIRWDAAAAVGYLANWRFVFAEQSYFETLLGPSPLRHTWSLAVEEQWYVLWPAVVVGLLFIAETVEATAGCHRVDHRRRRSVGRADGRALRPGRSAHGCTSAPTRAPSSSSSAPAWPGCLPARLPERRRARSAHALRRSWSPSLRSSSIAATTSDESAWLYHGGFVAVSLLCAVIVWAVADTDGPLPWLGARPLAWMGTRSYGIYLWHWPVIVFVGTPMGLELPRWWLAALQVALAVALAELSFRVIERRSEYPRCVPPTCSAAGRRCRR